MMSSSLPFVEISTFDGLSMVAEELTEPALSAVIRTIIT